MRQRLDQAAPCGRRLAGKPDRRNEMRSILATRKTRVAVLAIASLSLAAGTASTAFADSGATAAGAPISNVYSGSATWQNSATGAWLDATPSNDNVFSGGENGLFARFCGSVRVMR
jgi:hypothetical protein